MNCVTCQADLGSYERRKAFIALFVMGDEEIRSWWFCDACQVYSVGEYVDRFMGDEYDRVPYLVAKDIGDAEVALVATCPRNSDKWCTCDAHRRLGP